MAKIANSGDIFRNFHGALLQGRCLLPELFARSHIVENQAFNVGSCPERAAPNSSQSEVDENWTLLCFLFVATLGGVLDGLWPRAFQKEGKGAIVVRGDQAFIEHIAWRAVVSQRVKLVGKRILDTRTSWTLCVLNIVLEPLRYLTGWLLKISLSGSRANDAPAFESPPLLSWMGKRSPVIRVLQYYASLLNGAPPCRLR